MALPRLSLLSAGLILALSTSGCSSSVGDFFDDLFGGSTDQSSQVSVMPNNVASNRAQPKATLARVSEPQGPFCLREGRYLELSPARCIQAGGILMDERPSMEVEVPRASPSQTVTSEPLRDPNVHNASLGGKDPMGWNGRNGGSQQLAARRRAELAKDDHDGALINASMELSSPPLDYFQKTDEVGAGRSSRRNQTASLPSDNGEKVASLTLPPAGSRQPGAGALPEKPSYDLNSKSSYPVLKPAPTYTADQLKPVPRDIPTDPAQQQKEKEIQEEVLSMPTIRNLRAGQFSNLKGPAEGGQGGMTALMPFANLRR